MKRVAALLLCAALTAGAISGCGGGDDPYVPTGGALYEEGEEVTTQPPVTKDQITIPYYPEQSMNPFTCTEHGNKALLGLMYQGLFAVDEHYDSWPILCESYEMSWDMKTYTFTIADATFSDGSAVTPSDVAASLKAAKNSDVYRGRFSYVNQISVTDEGKVELQLDTPYENLPILLDIPIVKGGDKEDQYPIGSGPYVLIPGAVPVLQRQKNWWCNGAVPVTADKITLLEAGTPSQLRDDFEFSDLSMVSTNPASEDYADFHSDYELWESENGNFLYLGCNKASKVFAKAAVRQALAKAIDREAIVDEYYHGFASAAVLPASPHSPYYSAPLAAQYDYDPQALSQLLLGTNDNNQQPEQPTTAKDLPQITLLVNGKDSVRVKVAHHIAQNLQECGLKVKVMERSGDRYLTALNGEDYDLYLGQTRLSANMDLSAFFKEDGNLSAGGLQDKILYALCQDSLANIGNYYNLHQEVMEDAQLCPILFQSYAIYTQRGSFYGLTPSRDNLFFYHLGKTSEEVRVDA